MNFIQALGTDISIQFPNLHITLRNLPKGFDIFGLHIAFYGCIIAVGILVGIFIAYLEVKRTGQDFDRYINFTVIAIIFSVIGARIYYVAFNWDYYGSHPLQIPNIREGGLAIYGGIIAAVITCLVYTKARHMSFFLVLDTGTLPLLAGQIIGRWGNFFNREAFGEVTGDSNPFAMRIYFDDHYSIMQVPDSVKTAMEQMRGEALSVIGYIQVHPTFLYESLWNLFVFVLIFIFRKKKHFNGEMFLWYMAGYGFGRFFIESLRSDQLIMPGTGWPVSEFLSALVFVAAVAIWIICMLRRRRKSLKEA